MTDDFVLKWDGDKGQLYGEDPDSNTRTPIPFESVSTERLSSSRITSEFADSGDGSVGSPWVNALNNVVDEDRGHFILPPGVYEEDSDVVMTPAQRFEGAGKAVRDLTSDDAPRGVLIKPSSNWSGDDLLAMKQGSNTDAGIEYPMVENIVFDGDNTVDTLLRVGSVREARVYDCVFTNAADDVEGVVKNSARMTRIINNEWTQNANNYCIRIGGNLSRSVWIRQNDFVNTDGGVKLASDVFGGIWIDDNRFRQTDINYVNIEGYTESKTQVPIWITRNRMWEPGASTSKSSGFLGPGINLDNSFASTHPGPIWIAYNQIHGEQSDGSQTNEVAIESNWSGVGRTIHVVHNDVQGWGSSPAIDMSGIVADAELGSNSGQSIFENKGEATLSSGNTSVSVTHGLAATPNSQDIQVTPTGDLGSASYWYVDSIGSSSFNINLDADPTQNVTFAWDVAI